MLEKPAVALSSRLSGDATTALTPQQLATAVAVASDAVIAVDHLERITFFSDGAERIFGQSQRDVLGMPVEMLLPARFRASASHPLRASAHDPAHARRTGSVTEMIGIRKDGSEFPAEIALAVMRGGMDGACLLVLRDITEQKRDRARLVERQAQLSEAQRIAHIGSWRWDVKTNSVEWSEELYRIYGIDPEGAELTLDTFLQRVLPEDRATTRTNVERALTTGEPFDFEERIVRPDGAIRRLRSRGGVMYDATGRPARLMGVCQDITEQRAAEDAARQLLAEAAARAAAERAESRMTFLAMASAELASSLDYEETLRTVARLAVPAIADWSAVDIMVGSDLKRLAVEHIDPGKVRLAHEIQKRYPPDPDASYGVHHVIRTGRPEFIADIPDSMLAELARDEEWLRLVRQLGLRSYLAVPLVGVEGVLGAIVLVYAESGRIYTDADRLLAEDLARRATVAIENARLVSQLEDAHARLQEQAQELEMQAEETELQNEELQAQAYEMERLSNAKSDFMATVSHELRTPLNAIIGYAALLREGVPVAIPEPAALQVDRIRLGAQHLLQLIEEILTFSGLEAGSHHVATTDIATRVILDELQAFIQPLAARQDLEFRIRIDGAPDTLHTDPTKLRQVLLNLLSNAVKFTDEGSVTLVAGSRHGQPYFTVQDTGIGISDEHQQRLFEPFWQVDQSRARSREGAGLGLAIAHRVAALLGGEIDVTSKPGLGSEFVLRLPSSAAIDTATPVEKP